MPYISRPRREAFGELDEKIRATRIDTSGELNYLITMLMKTYLSQHGEHYRVLNEVIGAVECSKAEFERRKLFPLEHAKMAENGDVFGVPGATE